MLSRWKEEEKERVSILLFGPGEVTKHKLVEILHNRNKQEKKAYKLSIRNFLLYQLGNLIHDITALKLVIANESREIIQSWLETFPNLVFRAPLAKQITALCSDPSLAHVLSNYRHCNYFLKHIDVICTKGYLPSKRDIYEVVQHPIIEDRFWKHEKFQFKLTTLYHHPADQKNCWFQIS